MWTVVALCALVASLAYHLQLDLAGVVAVETLTVLLNREVRGSIEIGSIQNLTYEKVVARNVTVRDPAGREVIRAERLAAWPSWSALGAGAIYVDRVRLRGGVVTLIPSGSEESPTVSIAETFLLAHPSTGPPDPDPVRVVVNGIVIDDVTVRGDVPGFDGLRVEQVRVEGRVDVRGDAIVRIYRGRATMTGPYAGRTHLDEISGTIDSDLIDEGLRLWARGHRDDDRFRARLRVWQELVDGGPEETETHIDLRVALDPVRVQTLAEMEVASGLDNLDGIFRGHARLRGPVDDLRLNADLTSEAGRTYVSAHLPTEGALVIDLRTQGPLRLDRLVLGAPALRVGGRGRVTVEPAEGPDDEPTVRVHAETEPLSYDELLIPALSLDGMLEDDALRVEQLTSDVAGGEAAATGRIGFDGSLDVHVVARIPEISREPNVRRLAPDARGAVSASFDLRADAELENLGAAGSLEMRGARYGSVRADTLRLRGSAAGSAPAPNLRLSGEATGLEVGTLSLGRATLSLRGGPAGYRVSATSADPANGTRVSVEGRAVAREDRLTLDTSQLSLDLGDGSPWRGRLALTLRPGHSLELRPLQLSRGDEEILARGTYRFHGPDAFDVTATNIELSQLERLAPAQLEGIGGRANAHLVLSGDIDRSPQGELSARVRAGSLRGLDHVDGVAHLRLDGDALATEIQLDMGAHGQVRAAGVVQVPPGALLAPEQLAAQVDLSGLEIDTDDLDVGPLLALAGSDATLGARITTRSALAGSAAHPELRDAVLVLDRVALDGWDPLRLKAQLSYGADRIRVRHLWVANSAGELLQARADLPLSLHDLPTDRRSFWRTLNASTWSANLRLPPRRMESWPRPLRDRVPPGILVSGEVDAFGDANGPHAMIRAAARVMEIVDEQARCQSDLRPRLTLVGRLDDGTLTAGLLGYAGAPEPVVRGDVRAELDLDTWIAEGDVPAFPTTELHARIQGAEMGAVPYLCRYGSGAMFGTVTAKDFLTDEPLFGAVLDMPRVRVWQQAGDRGTPELTEAFRAHVRAGTTPQRDGLSACLVLGLAGTQATAGQRCRDAQRATEGELISRVRVPVTWTAGQALPTVAAERAISAWTDFHGVQVAPVVGLLPGVVAGEAIIRGQIEAEGPWETIRLSGSLNVSEGHVQIEGLGQHLHGISGRIELEGNEATFPFRYPLRASDAGGTALVNGHVGFEGLIPRTIDLTVATDHFPVRREGMVLAWLSGPASIAGRITDERMALTVNIYGGDDGGVQGGRFSIALPEETAGSLQPLEPHPQVLVVGSERVSAARNDDAYEVRVAINAEQAFWVRRNDFQVRVTANLTATYADPELRIGGTARITRGGFEIFGKRFELSEGRIVFGDRDRESAELDPQVRVLAVYNIPGRAGDSVTLEVTGSLTHPHIEFSSTLTEDQAEIIALLVSGARRQGGAAPASAEAQAASILTSLTVGILTLGLRQELGDVVPLLAIESQGLGGTRVRVGFTADELIPDVMRDVILSAYVEGFVTAAAEGGNAAGGSSGGGGVGGGVTVEFTLPDGLLLRGTYVPVDNGSLDLVYEP